MEPQGAPTEYTHDGEPSQRLTMRLIADCTPGPGNSDDPDERAEGLLEVDVLRLDWQRISTIENLDVFTNVRELYLQHNRIQSIDELDALISLEFLALGSNRISRLENLRHLKKLQVLDLSNNLIEDFDTQELPTSLVIFNLADNPCCLDRGFRQKVTNALSDMMFLNGKAVNRSPHDPAAREDCEGTLEQTQLMLEECLPCGGDAVTLYVTVHSDGASNVFPFHFLSCDNLTQKAAEFCLEHGLSGEAASVLLNKMERAIGGKARHNDVKGHLVEQPQSEERVDRRKNERLNAIVSLQQARARLMEESTASFEQHKKSILSTTRKLVEQKTAAAHGRSDALDGDIRKILDDARVGLQLRRERLSAENRDFATDMRQKIDLVMAERRRKSEEAAARVVVVASSLPTEETKT